MSKSLLFKVAQISGALLLAAGVTSCQLRADSYTSTLFLLGAVLYGAGRIAAWLIDR